MRDFKATIVIPFDSEKYTHSTSDSRNSAVCWQDQHVA